MPVLERDVLIPLAEVTSAGQAGTKALRLADLARQGVPVPEAFVLPAGSGHLPEEGLLDRLGGCVAVRSSATAEDLDGASFAGQFRTVLNVRTPGELASAVAEVRASVSGEPVRAYCATRRIDPSGIRMAVLLQRMVRAEVSGVLFTVDPVSGCENEMLVEACAGLGEDLVGGRVSGVRIAVRDGQPDGPNALLTPGQVRQLVQAGRRVQWLMGCPQDIEWAFEAGQLFVLQARPITRLSFNGVEGEWTNADFRDGGVASDVVTPLMWSLYERVWDRALKGFLRDLRLFEGDFPAARLFYGRPYWNLAAVKRCARKLPGFVEREFDRDLGVRPGYGGDGARTPVTLRSLWKALGTVLGVRRAFRRQEARDWHLLGADQPCPSDADLEGLDDRGLLDRFRELLEEVHLPVEENYFRTIFCVALARLDFKTSFGDLPAPWTALVGGLEGLSHFECAQALWEVANGAPGEGHGWPEVYRRGLEAFLARYGHHSRRELDLRVPRWSEDVPFVVEMARKVVGTESPWEANRRQCRQYRTALEQARHCLPFWRRPRFRRKLLRLRRFLWLREEMRDRSTRVYAHVRRLVCAIGRRAAAAGCLASPDDVFYLTAREIERVFDLPYGRVIESRRDHERMYRHFRPPNEVGRGFSLAPAAPAGRRLTGIGCGSGAGEGRARVVTHLGDAGKLEPGDVLVCPFTDPGWTPLLAVAGGVITETGGLLSHAAVLCREYALPAVLNVAGATRLLRDGERVRVDGENGHVDIL
jgi:phosphohistidine swiveling domain-containing protein